MPDRHGDNDEDIVGLDWLTSQLSDDDAPAEGEGEDAGADGPAESADTAESVAFASAPDADEDEAPTVAMPVVPAASSRELRFSSTPSAPDSDVSGEATAESYPSRAERIEAQRAEADRIEAERVDAARVVAIRVAAERVAAEEAAAADAAESERLEAERLEAERLEAERLEAERLEAERVEAERVEAERAQAARREADRADAERVEFERVEAERVEAERVEAERLGAERVENERAEAERLESERAEADRVEAERAEANGVAAAPVEAPEAGIPDGGIPDAEPTATEVAAGSREADDESDDEPVGDEADAEPVFLWGLTPTIEPDPVVESRRAQERTGLTAEPAPEKEISPPDDVPAGAAPAAPVRSHSTPPPAVPAASVPAASGPAAPTESLTKPPFTARRPLSDPEAAPWWTTPAQARLVPTADEATAAERRRIVGAQDTAPSGQPTGAPDVAAVPAAPADRDARSAAPVVTGATAATAHPAAVAVPTPLASASTPTVADDNRSTGDTGRTGNDDVPPKRPNNRTLAWAGTAVLTILVLIGLFFLSQSLGDSPVAAPVATQSEAASPPAESAPSPEPVPAPAGPQPAGVHAWNTMFGSECLEPYTSPWDEEFTVVDCGAPHTAQLVSRGILEGESGSPFPGEQAFADQINVLCSAPGVIDFGAAAAYDDLQLQGSYPVTAEQWDNGDRYFYCFASRSSGEPLNTSLAPVA